MVDTDVYKLSTKNDFYGFEFVSQGTQGDIQKIIVFSETPVENLYNLGFGDKDPITGKVDDLVVSNNGDTDKVLATVANAVFLFTEKNPGFIVFAEGSTPARTRLYRMGIQRYWEDITSFFEVWGFFQNDWEIFIPNRAYQSFLVRRKNNDI